MTGIMMAGNAGGGIIGNPTPWTASYSAAAGTGNSCSASYQLTEGGLASASGTGTVVSQINGTNWYQPQRGVGALTYYARVTRTAGVDPDNGAAMLGVWTLIVGNLIFSFNSYTTPINKTCTLKTEIASDAAGTNIVFTCPGNVIAVNHA